MLDSHIYGGPIKAKNRSKEPGVTAESVCSQAMLNSNLGREYDLGDSLYDFFKGKLVKIPLPLRGAAGRGDWCRPGRLADV